MRPALFRACVWCVFVIFGALPCLGQHSGELDNSVSKLELNAWISDPTGYFNGQSSEGYFDLKRDFGFGNYATFSGKWDWRFKRKHHLMFAFTPAFTSRSVTLTRTISWQGQTYDVGTKTESDIRSLIFTPAYQWDFLRRRSFWLALLVNGNLIYTDAKLKASVAASGGGGSAGASKQSDGSLFAPLPAVGPHVRWYPIPSSARFYLDGTLTAMSFFGYGNFVSGNAVVGFPLSRGWDMRGGYLVGSRFKVYGGSDQVGIRLTQKGPTVGVEYHWGTR